MPDAEIVHTLINTIGSLLVMLMGIIGWIGSKIHARLDEISKTLTIIDKDLRTELSHLDNRVTRVEVLFQNRKDIQ